MAWRGINSRNCHCRVYLTATRHQTASTGGFAKTCVGTISKFRWQTGPGSGPSTIVVCSCRRSLNIAIIPLLVDCRIRFDLNMCLKVHPNHPSRQGHTFFHRIDLGSPAVHAHVRNEAQTMVVKLRKNLVDASASIKLLVNNICGDTFVHAHSGLLQLQSATKLYSHFSLHQAPSSQKIGERVGRVSRLPTRVARSLCSLAARIQYRWMRRLSSCLRKADRAQYHCKSRNETASRRVSLIALSDPK